MFPLWVKKWNCPKADQVTGRCYIDENGNYCDNGLARVLAFDRLVNPEQSIFFNWEKPFGTTGNYQRMLQYLCFLC